MSTRSDQAQKISRRELLWGVGNGIGGLALCELLARDNLLASEGSTALSPLSPKKPHYPAKAKAVISIFMNGGTSQIDTFDRKPELDRHHGEAPPKNMSIETFFPYPGTFLKSPFNFQRYGQSGYEISDLFRHTATCIDDIALIRSMRALSNNHNPAILQMMTGVIQPGRPSLGSWTVYGLGTENQNLPAFVVLLDKTGGPLGGAQLWSSGFIPAAYQGTALRNQGDPIADLASPKYVTDKQQRARLDFIKELNEMKLAESGDDAELSARIASYELAYRMQSHAPEAVDLAKESEATKKLYGIDDPECEHFGKNCLLARRLVERGVRFVQLYAGSNAADSWDAHADLEGNHTKRAHAADKPIAGLLKDLKSRGLLDSTLVVWHTEFGRLPVSQSINGRDHNPKGFTVWLAGGGAKGGSVVGATDDFGYAAVQDPHTINDLHATILHLLGMDHTRLTYVYNGRPFRLTDVAGDVIKAALV